MDQPYQAAPDVYVLPTHLSIPGAGNLIINSYVLRSQEPVLVDTGLGIDSPDFVAAVDSIVPLRDLRWIWLTHDDSDHTGCIQKLMTLAPNARLATQAFVAMRMTTWWPVPLDRVHAITFDDRLDVGDRTLRAVHPPTFDNPLSTGILDESTGTLFSVDSFGAILPELTNNCSEIPADVLAQGMTAWGTMDSPWLHLVDGARFDAVLERVQQLQPNLILSSHLPAATGTCSAFLDIVRSMPAAAPFQHPNNEAFQQMLAMIGPMPATTAAAATTNGAPVAARAPAG